MNNLNLFLNRWRSGINEPRPVRDWHLLLITTLFLLVGVTTWSLWVFQTIVTGGTVGVPTPSYTKSERYVNPVDTVRNVYGARAVEESNYSAGAYSYTDPSL